MKHGLYFNDMWWFSPDVLEFSPSNFGEDDHLVDLRIVG